MEMNDRALAGESGCGTVEKVRDHSAVEALLLNRFRQ
jgi:hypothetical protein